jgi:hypothetical protein
VRPGSIRSGEKASAKSRPAARPDSSRIGRSRSRGRLEHHQLSLAHHPRQGATRVDDIGEVWLALVRERRRHADHDRIAAAELVVVGCHAQQRTDRREALVAHILHGAAALVDLRHAALVDVDAEHLVAGLGEGDRERQPHIAQPDDPDSHDGAV